MTNQRRGGRGEPEALPPSARFSLGAWVRVKWGTPDPDYPDIPLGGWKGTIQEVDATVVPPGYLIAWDGHTLQHQPSVFRQRCRRDDLEADCMWLDEDMLEPATADAPPHLEEPTDVITRPLQPDDQDDRIRRVFGLTSDDPLPDVEKETLAQYHVYLAANLSFPFETRLVPSDGPPQPMAVVGLVPQEDCDTLDGLVCEVRVGEEEDVWPLAEIEVPDDPDRRRLVEDYSYWFQSFGEDGQPDQDSFLGAVADDPLQGTPEGQGAQSLRGLLHRCGLFGAGCGATLGAIVAALDDALWMMGVVALVLAVLFGLLGSRYGRLLRQRGMAGARAPFVGTAFGLLIGAAVGAVLGALCVAFVGTVPGSIVGTILGSLVVGPARKAAGKLYGGLLGAGLGGIVWAVSQNQQRALTGVLLGTIVGAVGIVVLVLLVLVGLALLMNRRRE